MSKTTVFFAVPPNGNKEQRHGFSLSKDVESLKQARKLVQAVDDFLTKRIGLNYAQASICSRRKYIKQAVGNCNASDIVFSETGNDFTIEDLKNFIA
jgi:hypothetical protein